MLRRVALFALGVAVALLLVVFGLSRMTTTVTVGSGPPALIQSGSIVSTTSAHPVGTLAAPSTSGTTLLAIIANASGSGPATITSPLPAGWTQWVTGVQGSQSELELWAYANNPGGISAVTFNGTASASWVVHLSEWSNLRITTVPGYWSNVSAGTDAEVASAGTSLPLSVTPPVSSLIGTQVLALTAWIQYIGGAATATFTSPPGFTRLTDNGASSLTAHLDIEYGLVSPNSVIQPTLTSSQTTTSAAGVLIALVSASPAADQSAYLRNDSMQFKLNTGDFGLVLGGKLQLEDGSGFLQLEDGSGVYLLDTYIPQLGDPVTVTNPTWSGRVVSTNVHDLDDVLTNYRLVDVTATNTTSAPGGSAPGDFSDVPFGQYILQEDGLSKILLEDGSGSLELEGTSVGYRSLQVQKSQNIDGTVTVYGSLTTFQSGFAAGQVIGLTSQNQGYSGNQFTITNVTNTWMDQLPVFVVEFGDAYQTLQTAGGGVLTKIGSQAGIQAGINMPAGTLGYAQLTDATGLAGLPNLTDITGLATTVTVVAGRRVHIRGFATLTKHTAAQLALDLFEGATQLSQWYLSAAADGASYTAQVDVVLTPSAGVHTYKLTVGVSAGTVDVTPSTVLPNFLWVQDVGT